MAQDRNSIDKKYKWNLSDIIESDAAWEKEVEALKIELPQIEKFKGRLSDKEQVKALFALEHDLMLRLERVFVYAKMNRDQDNSNSVYTGMTDRAAALLTSADTTTSFIVPELTKLDDGVLREWAKEKCFEARSHFFNEIIRNKPHVLSESEERLLALSGEIASSYDNIYTMLEDVDMSFAPVNGANGEQIELSHGKYGVLLESFDRDTRRQAYESMYNAHIENNNTLAALYASSVKKDVFYARARGFKGTLEAELFGSDVPVSVYDGLVAAVHEGLPALHRYVELRKRVLELDDMKMYDMYVPLVNKAQEKVTYEQAQQCVLEALAPMGDEYLNALKQAYSGGWIDVFETKGKTSGAYAWGAYGVHPFMLLNFQGRSDDIFTLAHESGHAMHSFFSDGALPYEKAQYKIFVAEVASTVNEVMLLKHMLKTRPEDRVYLLNHFLDQFRTTVFRQTMFAEFERAAHEQAENDGSLTAEWLNDTYAGLNREYYSNAVDTDKFIASEWSRIPHFYNAFYVYQYATGFSAAVAIVENILSQGEKAVKNYMRFLSSGGSDSPVELLKLAGVDLSKPDTVEEGMRVFEKTLEEFKELI